MVIVVKAFRILIAGAVAVLACAVMAAAPAKADEESYLNHLQPKYPFLTAQQLLAEGHKVCQAERSGMTSSDAAKMVYEELGRQGLSVPGAIDIVTTAVIELGC